MKKLIQSTTALILLFALSNGLSAQQLQVEITNPTPDPATGVYTVDCEESIQFNATASDFTDPNNPVVLSPLSVTWQWNLLGSSCTLPASFNSSISNPVLDPNNQVMCSGEYEVIAQAGGLEARDTVEIVVLPTFDWTCPTPIIVTPDLNATDASGNPTCRKTLDFAGFQLDTVNCRDANYTWCVSLTAINSSVPIYTSATSGNGIDETAFDATYGAFALDDLGVVTGSGSGVGTATGGIDFGSYNLRIDIKQGAEIVDQCIVPVDVLESRNNLACNDLVNVTLSENCQGIITTDMILEGDYCFDNFVISALLEGGSDTISNTAEIVINQTGTYTVTVTGQSGLSCWGRVFAEDKSTPELNCDEVTVLCTEVGNLAPGSSIKGWDRAVATETNATSINLVIDDVNGIVTDVVFNFEANVDDIGDLALTLTSPDGTMVDVLDQSGFTTACDNSNINVCFSDTGELDHAMFGSPVHCRETENAFIGSFKPAEAFSGFNGDDANGTWVLAVTYSGAATDIVVEADLQVTTNEGNLLTSMEVIENSGCDASPEFTWSDEEVGVNCADNLWTVIERTWTVVNTSSGQSASCSQTINVRRFGVSDIIWPKSFDDIDQPSLTCDDNTNTGQPGLPCNNDITGCGNFQMSGPTEIDFPICGNSYKRIYSWTVLDWCSGEIAEYDQVVKVEDSEPLVVTCAPDDLDPADVAFFQSIGVNLASEMPYLTTTNPGACSGDWEFVPNLVIDNPCDDAYTVQLSYLLADPNDPLNPDPLADYITDNVVTDGQGNPVRITDLPGGQFTWIRITVTDECGNEGECFTEVYVKDDTSPNPVCVEFTVVALGDNGCGYLPASSVDNDSWDNCGIASYHVRRAGTGTFADQIELCCVDCSDGPIAVELLVTDNDGNTNTCSAEVRLQDNIPIRMVSTPPADMTFNCENSPIDITSFVNDALAGFQFEDNCGWDNNSSTVVLKDAATVNYQLERGQCGEGSTSVQYEIYDRCGNEVPGSPFTQRFSFVPNTNASAFNVTSWPQDLTLTQCLGLSSLDPDALDNAFNENAINANTSVCNDLAIGYDDLVFYNVDNACLKILRTWTVVDWCLANAGNNTLADATRQHTQEIKIFDNEPPVATLPSVTVETFSDNCEMMVDSLIATVTDACTDMFGNQENITTFTITYADGRTPRNGTGTDASGVFPVGTNTITWTVEDHCGNVADYTTSVTVVDAKAPTPYCLAAVVTATMNTDGSVEIWADDYSLGGEDNCDTDLDVYFESNGQISRRFDCNDIPNGVQANIELRIVFEDDAGNSDFCRVQLILQDNESDLCTDTGSLAAITGNVHNEEFETIEEVMVSLLSDSEAMNSQMMTINDGEYAFMNLTPGIGYSVSGQKDDHPLNGVSTLDIVIIQRHILGSTPLDSPYKVIAADANNDQNVTAIDLIELRKLILGITNEFPNGQTPWRFPVEAQNFVNSSDPFPYEENITYAGLNEHMADQDFVGVKIGDVNGSAIVSGLKSNEDTDRRSSNAVTFEMQERTLDAGTQVTIPVTVANMNDIIGFQNTLNYDASALKFVGIESNTIDIEESNVALYNEGSIAISWNALEAISLNDGETLFELTFDVVDNTTTNSQFFLSNNVTKTEAYTNDLEVLDIELNVRGIENADFVLYQNVPNPFSTQTDIQFQLPGDSKVVLRVYDVSGRELLTQTNNYTKGNHTITVTKEQLKSSSVMYYKLETEYGTASKKMIQIR